MVALLCLILLCSLANVGFCWQQWTWNDTLGSPGPRRGHNMVIMGEKIYLFGGRSNDITQNHVPKTFKIIDVKGIFEVATYTNRTVKPCTPNTPKADDSCTPDIPVGLYFNDMWVYDLNCTRWDDLSCNNTGWQVVDHGAILGGCKIYYDSSGTAQERCTHPAERYEATMEILDDQNLLVYGGFAQTCVDYCRDFWTFNLHTLKWTQLLHGKNYNNNPEGRYKAASTKNNDGSSVYLFGGYRLWQGFSPANSYTNSWDMTDPFPSDSAPSTTGFPPGGFLKDMWVMQSTYSNSTGFTINWTQLQPLSVCVKAPGITWAERFDTSCTTTWPSERMGHVLLFHNDTIYLQGGYRTTFPYPLTSSAGSGIGVTTASYSGYVPYPDYPYYLDDLWTFNISSGLWTELIPISVLNPAPRMDHIMIVSGNAFLLYGGYRSNELFGDFWIYNITTNRWLEKTYFVHALYPSNCTDDVLANQQRSRILAQDEQIIDASLSRRLSWTDSYEAALQSGNPRNGPFVNWIPVPRVVISDGIVNASTAWYKGVSFDKLTHVMCTKLQNSTWSGRTLETAEWSDCSCIVNASFVGDWVNYEWSSGAWTAGNCINLEDIWPMQMSVFGNPTRGTLLDGLFGRMDTDLIIPQERRRAPGWDGCRDRVDGRTDLPQELQWLQPTARRGHKGIYYEKEGIWLIYGGEAIAEITLPSYTVTTLTTVVGEFWEYSIHKCPSNCSNVGDCFYGFCFCNEGYYGIDCSNVTCPGDFCYYNLIDHEQYCLHCSHGEWNHTDGELYQYNVRKAPSNLLNEGESHGICDGFGTCQCAPPFLDEDCSIKDCPNQCNGHGYCSLEFPVSRCICNDLWIGLDCNTLTCLNNCSYPNGACLPDGTCNCTIIYSPYNNTVPYVTWMGEDCSYLTPFTGIYP